MEQRQLVERERPGRPGGNREGEAADPALFWLPRAPRRRHPCRLAPWNREAPERRVSRPRSGGNDQSVIREPLPTALTHFPALGVNGGSGRQTGDMKLIRGDPLERETTHHAQLEGLGDPQRAVRQSSGVRREQLDARALPGDCPEGEQRLDGGDAPARYEHVRALASLADSAPSCD